MNEVRPNIGVPARYRYETKPGIQAQVDWAECGYIEIDGEKRKLYCFTMVLGYSRMRFSFIHHIQNINTIIKYLIMESATYKIIDSFPEIAAFIYSSSISTSSLYLQDEIAKKFNVKVSSQTITKWRKQLPASKIQCLQKEKAKNILNLQFVVDLLKNQIGEIEDPTLKLKYSQEISRTVKQINLLIDKEIENLRNSKPF